MRRYWARRRGAGICGLFNVSQRTRSHCGANASPASCIARQLDMFAIGSSGKAPESVFRTMLAIGVLVGSLDGIGQGALYGDAALLPPEYTHVSP